MIKILGILPFPFTEIAWNVRSWMEWRRNIADNGWEFAQATTNAAS